MKNVYPSVKQHHQSHRKGANLYAENRDIDLSQMLILIEAPTPSDCSPIFICSIDQQHLSKVYPVGSTSDSAYSKLPGIILPSAKQKVLSFFTPKNKTSKHSKSRGIWRSNWGKACVATSADFTTMKLEREIDDHIKSHWDGGNVVDGIKIISEKESSFVRKSINNDLENVPREIDEGAATILYKNQRLLQHSLDPHSAFVSPENSLSSIFISNHFRSVKSTSVKFSHKPVVPTSGDSTKIHNVSRTKHLRDRHKSKIPKEHHTNKIKQLSAHSLKGMREVGSWLKGKRIQDQFNKMKMLRCKSLGADVRYPKVNRDFLKASTSKSSVNVKFQQKNKYTTRYHITRECVLKRRKKEIYSISLKIPSRNIIPYQLPYFLFGERGSGFRREEPQDFYKLRDECLENGTIFEDPEFPPTDSSLFYSRRPDRNYEWRRPHEIADDPQFFVEGYSRFDVQQGELGDCWLLAAVANLTLYKRLFFQVVPDDQGFEDKYAGIFHFRFWQYGRWVDVVIDDRLPTYRGQLVFLHSTEENEFWSALLEKAYAKLHGSYEALKGGSTCEAMEDFTGGVTEMYEMNASPPNLFKIVLKAYERSSLMGASLEPDPNVLEAETSEGLIRGHAYSITRVRYVDIETPNTRGKIPLLRLRNPWGNEAEWNGPWSDKSPEWRFIPEHEKQELGLTFDIDGEFWISFKDFMQHFDRLEICNLNPDSLTEEELSEGHKKRWEVSFFEGEWVRGVTAGGCRNYLDTFSHNPQYRVTLTEVDEDDEDGKCTLIVALMQKNRRSQRNMGIDVLTVGFAIYHLPYPDSVPKPLDLNFFKYNASVARSPSFINLREVSCRFKLPPGTYCIVPSTFEPNEEGEFLLRVFSENQNNMEENDAQIGFGEVDKRVRTIQPAPEQNHVNDQVYEFFKKLAGEDGEVDWMELKQVLDYAMRLELQNKGFSKDVCRSMVAMLDTDHSGKLGFQEFKTLWSDVRDWKMAFRLYDKDNSGTLDGYELRQAFTSAGYNLNYHVLNILMHRYGNNNGQMEFNDFIMCAVKLKTMLDIFEIKNEDHNNLAKFSVDEWISSTLYA